MFLLTYFVADMDIFDAFLHIYNKQEYYYKIL